MGVHAMTLFTTKPDDLLFKKRKSNPYNTLFLYRVSDALLLSLAGLGFTLTIHRQSSCAPKIPHKPYLQAW